MAATRRRGAYASGMLTLAVFLAPALLAPGPVEAANIAGIALAVWLAVDAWRIYGRDDLRATLPYRVAPVAPGLLGSAAIIFIVALAVAWIGWTRGGHPDLDRAYVAAAALWDFPLSPIRMTAKATAGLPTISEETIRTMTLCLTVGVGAGLVFGLFSLFGRIDQRGSLRKHAIIWKGERAPDPQRELEARGARGLQPLCDGADAVARTPVSGRLALRAVSMIVAILFLPYAPLFLRFLGASGVPAIEKIYESPLAENAFFNIWLIGLWAMIVAAAIILFFAYIRLALALRVR